MAQDFWDSPSVNRGQTVATGITACILQQVKGFSLFGGTLIITLYPSLSSCSLSYILA